MENKNVLDLLREINEGVYCEVLIPAMDPGSRIFHVTSVASHSSRFNFSLVGVYEGSGYRTVPVIKDGVLDQKYIACKRDKFSEFTLYTLESMPLYSTEVPEWERPVNMETLLEQMLEEYRISEYVDFYKSLKKEYSTEAPSPRSSHTSDDEEQETNVKTTIVPCVTYQIQTELEPLSVKSSLRESCLTWEDADKEYRRYNEKKKSARFDTRSYIYLLEKSGKFAEAEWSEAKPLPRSKKKSFQETVLLHEGKELTIRRIFWNDEIKL